MFSIRVNGKLIPEIEELSFQENIETILSEYEVKHNNKELTDEILVDKNAVVEIYYQGEKIKKCFIDTVEEKKTLNGTEMKFSGRSSLCDIVDSHVELYEFTNIKYIDLINKLIAPYKIKVVGKGDGIIEKATFDEKDSVFDALKKYTDQFGIILDEGSDGELVITEKSEEIVGVYGETDFSQVTFSTDNSELYSTYHIAANKAPKVEAKVTDPDIRYRYLYEQVDVADKDRLKKMVEMKKAVMKNESEKISIPAIKGFQFKDGSRIRTNVNIRLKTGRVDSTFYITGYKLTATKAEVLTSLEIKRRDSYNDKQGSGGIYD